MSPRSTSITRPNHLAFFFWPVHAPVYIRVTSPSRACPLHPVLPLFAIQELSSLDVYPVV